MNELHDKYSSGKCTEGFDKLWNLAQEHDLNSNSDQTWAAVKRGFKPEAVSLFRTVSKRTDCCIFASCFFEFLSRFFVFVACYKV